MIKSVPVTTAHAPPWVFGAPIRKQDFRRSPHDRFKIKVMIKFGTSGWRAIIADEFSLDAVRHLAQAISDWIIDRAPGSRVIVGYDTRFMAETFAAAGAAVLASTDLRPLLGDSATPIPAVAFAVRSRGACGAINFTASHNPPKYCGMKFSASDGAPALPEVTAEIDFNIPKIEGNQIRKPANVEVESISVVDDYLNDIGTKIDLASISRAGLRVACDPLWGTGRGYLNKALADAGAEIFMRHDYSDVYFGGHSPTPEAEYLGELRDTVLKGGYDFGLSHDGDADSFASSSSMTGPGF